MSFLLDTDICSALLKGEQHVWGKAIQYTGRLHISAITAAELYAWVLRASTSPKRLQALLDFYLDVKFLSVEEEVARRFGEVRAHQLDTGKPAPAMDLLIASTALVHDLVLVTHNSQDYGNVPGLVIEDWLVQS